MLASLVAEPATLPQVLALADLCLQTGLRDRAEIVLKRGLDRTGLAPDSLLTCYGTLLVETQNGLALQDLALSLRTKAGRPACRVYSDYLEARLALVKGQTQEISDLIAKLQTVDYDSPTIGLAIAAGLIEIGADARASAGTILTNLEPALKEDPRYWQVRAQAARSQTNEAMLVQATKHQHDLDPVDVRSTLDFAAALMVCRGDPAPVLHLTEPVFKAAPANPAVRVHHAAALAMGGQADHCLALLLPINENNLLPRDRALCLLTRFEANASLARIEAARTTLDRIERHYLFPRQSAWLTDTAEKLAIRPAGAGSKN